MSDVLLEVKGMTKWFGGIKAVNDLSFSVMDGQIKAVIGPNGAGKTTAFNLISGIYPLTAGEILFDGVNITGMPPFRVAEMGIIRTFQNIRLFEEMSVLENVMVGVHRLTKSGFLSSIFKPPRTRREEKEIREKAMSALNFVGLADNADDDAGSLPMGRQRILELARAIASEPRLLMLDEPAAGLNITETEELGDLILKIRDSGVTLLLVEHDMSLVMEISDEVVALNNGEKIAEGLPGEIQENPEVIKAYLGTEDD